MEARLTLFAQRSGSTQASHLVFVLRSRVDARLPKQNLEVKTECYQATSVEFEVVNPFDAPTTFEVKLHQQCLESTAGPMPKVAVAKQKPGHKPKKGEGERSEEEVLMFDALQQPFGTKQVGIAPGLRVTAEKVCQQLATHEHVFCVHSCFLLTWLPTRPRCSSSLGPRASWRSR